MAITVTRLGPSFAARIGGVDITRPQFCHRHEWTEGDLVIWDNRCILHRATPYDTTRYKRLMQRTTVSGDPAELAHVR